MNVKSLCAARRWILGWAIIALLGLQIIESSHHHTSAALDEACSLCQVAAHQLLDLAPPAISSLLAVLILLFIRPRWRLTLRVASTRRTSYHSRAPPYRAA